MSMSIGGIVSGLQTDQIIESLMKIEALPQSMLQNKKTTTESFITALQALNVKIGSLTEFAGKASSAKGFDVWKGSSSDASVSVNAGEGSTGANLEFQVDKLAMGRSVLSGSMTDASSLLTGGSFTFTDGGGETRTVTPASEALTDLVNAVNSDSALGIKATLITTTDGSRIQFTSSTTGAAKGNFSIISGGAEAGFDQIRGSQDAQITLWPGLGLAGSTVTSSSNTFSDLTPGVSVTVSKVGAAGDPAVTVSVNKDTAAINKLGEGLVAQVNQVLEEIASRSKVTTTTGDNGKSTTKGGIFTGDSTARQLTSQLTEAVLHPINGKSPSEIGISLDKGGAFKFDAEKFGKALTEDPTGTQDMLMQIAGRAETVGKSMSDKHDGTLSLRIQSQNSLVTEYGKQIESWDIRLAQRRESLTKMYTAMEIALSNLQAQGSQLASQLGSLGNQNGN